MRFQVHLSPDEDLLLIQLSYDHEKVIETVTSDVKMANAKDIDVLDISG